MHGGKRIGAGRKPGTPNRPKAEIRKERALKEMARVAKEQAKRKAAEAEREAEAKARAQEEQPPRPPPERGKVEILPPLPSLHMPPNVEPLEFLKNLMRNDELPLGFRRDCAALALPYAHAKPILGLKDARRLAAFDDDDDDEIAQALRN